MPKNAKALAAEIQGIWDAADREGRELEPGERAHMEQLVEQAQSQHRIEQQIKGLDPGSFSFVTHPSGGRLAGAPGDQFIASKGWQEIANPGTRPQTWSTGAIEVGSFKAGTLFEGAGGQGAGLIPLPQVIPGVVEKLFEPLGVADVFASGQTTNKDIRYVVEGTATNAAAGVAEGGDKPPFDLTLSTTDEPVKKIATVLTVSDEILEDASTIQTYLNSRLSLFVKLEEERQLLRGAGTNELVGMFGRGGINQYTKAAGDDNTTALAKVIANTRGSSFLQPDAVVLHPTNWLNMRLLRDGAGGTAGQYFGGGPFGGAYGNGGEPGLFGESIWSTRVVLSTIVGPGTALVGSFGQAAVRRPPARFKTERESPLTDREPLTDEESQAVTKACADEPKGWVPQPEELPLADQLVARRTFTRKMVDGEAVYHVSDEFKAAAALHAAMGPTSPN